MQPGEGFPAVVGRRPAVSVCIPTYNGESWIADSIRSALRQDMGDLEIVVSDDGSGDRTVSIARSFDDPRVRVISHASRVGMAQNWNRCLQAARGDYIKPLMQDDLLEPTCVRKMARVMDSHASIGLVFSPRLVDFADPDHPDARTWYDKFGVLHRNLPPLTERSHGRAIFDAIRQNGFAYNWIGEPTAVMLRRSVLEDLGLFNIRLRQLTDLELWLRIAFFNDIGFVPEPLVTFRVHEASTSSVNQREGTAWLDRIWLMEGLRAHPEIRDTLGWRSTLTTWRSLLLSIGKRLLTHPCRFTTREIADLYAYARFKLGLDRADLHATLERQTNATNRAPTSLQARLHDDA